MTDEQLGVYLDRAADRLRREFIDRAEAVRVGTVAALDKKAAQRWRTIVASSTPRKRGLVGQALETAVSALALRNPEYVVRGAA